MWDWGSGLFRSGRKIKGLVWSQYQEGERGSSGRVGGAGQEAGRGPKGERKQRGRVGKGGIPGGLGGDGLSVWGTCKRGRGDLLGSVGTECGGSRPGGIGRLRGWRGEPGGPPHGRSARHWRAQGEGRTEW